MKQALKRGEGCNIFGWLEVPRVAGNLHFSGETGGLRQSCSEDEAEHMGCAHRCQLCHVVL